MFIQALYSTHHPHRHLFLLAYMKRNIFSLTYTWAASMFIVQCWCVECPGVDVSTSWCCAVSLGSDYGAWCRVTVRRLSCTATLILSINNNPPHCRPEPHLLITICHLSAAPPHTTPTPSLFSCALLLHPSQQGQLSFAPPHRTSSHPSPQLRLCSTQRHGPAYRGLLSSFTHTFLFNHFNRTVEGIWLIKSSPALIGQIIVHISDYLYCFGSNQLKFYYNKY